MPSRSGQHVRNQPGPRLAFLPKRWLLYCLRNGLPPFHPVQSSGWAGLASQGKRDGLVKPPVLLAAVVVGLTGCAPGPPETRFDVSFPGELHDGPITGRAYVVIGSEPEIAAIRQRSLGHQPVSNARGVPFFAVDVEGLAPDEPAVIDGSTPGYPVASLGELAAGDYYVQALLVPYTEFQRSDGHVIWAHRDEWEGQHFNWAPGTLLSDVERVRLDAAGGFSVRLRLVEELPEIEVPPDDTWVRRVKFESPMLSEFWGQPVYLGATVLLPEGYDAHPDTWYPTVYQQGHFSLDPPFGLSAEPVEESEAARAARLKRGVENGFEFFESWRSPGFPRMIAVTFQHPTPYFDDSYAVNSANNGPYQDALMTELIPYLEERFRMIPEGWARLLTGGSTGGYEALALQAHRPNDFGGAWVFYPDPIDFRRFFLINIYEDENAFRAPGWSDGQLAPERYAFRDDDGQPLQSIRELSRLASVLGSRGRSTDYLEAWEASFGPVGDDGYPRPLWDKRTGVIDHEVARYWRENGYDLRYYLETNWGEIGLSHRGVPGGHREPLLRGFVPLRTAQQGTRLDAGHERGAVPGDGGAPDAECAAGRRYPRVEVLTGARPPAGH